jgi:AcrR family transcriptional regulator
MATDLQGLTGKALLLSVARDLFLQDGYNGVSIQQIAEAAHMTKGSPYYHFKNKEDLFTQVFVGEIRHLLAGFEETIALPGPLEERVFRAFQFILAHGNEGFSRIHDDFDRYIAPHLDPKVKELDGITSDTVRDVFLPLIDDASAAGVHFRFERERAAHFLFMVTMGHFEMQASKGEGRVPADQIDAYAAELTAFVLHGLVEGNTTS